MRILVVEDEHKLASEPGLLRTIHGTGYPLRVAAA